MTPIEELRRIIIQKLHLECKSYEEALSIEWEVFCRNSGIKHPIEIIPEFKGLSITVARIMQALNSEFLFQRMDTLVGIYACDIVVVDDVVLRKLIFLLCLRLTLPNGQDAILEDQTEETISKLLDLIKNGEKGDFT